MAKTRPPTIITLTLDEDALESRATLLIQRGELAKLSQFTFSSTDELSAGIDKARKALQHLEASPPEEKSDKNKSAPKKQGEPKSSNEPTLDLPTKEGPLSVPMSYLKIVQGETDAASYRQAVLLGARLIDAGLWDGASALRLANVHEAMKKIKHLSDEEIGSLFTLQEFNHEETST